MWPFADKTLRAKVNPIILPEASEAEASNAGEQLAEE
jgi:hypothetical protein